MSLILFSPPFQEEIFGFPADYSPEIAFGITSDIVLGTKTSVVFNIKSRGFERGGSREGESKDDEACMEHHLKYAKL